MTSTPLTLRASSLSRSSPSHGDDVPDALRLQFGDIVLQRCPGIPEGGLGAGCRQCGDVIIGQPDDAYSGPAYRLDKIGAYAAPGQGAALLRRQIGGQYGQGLDFEEAGQLTASLVEFMIAQGHGVIGQQRVRSGDHGPLVDAVEQGPLELVARIQGDDVVLLVPCCPDGRTDACQAAAAVCGLEAGIHMRIGARKEGVGVIHMQDAQLQAASHRFAVCGAAGRQEQQQGTKESRDRQGQRLFLWQRGHGSILSC